MQAVWFNQRSWRSFVLLQLDGQFFADAMKCRKSISGITYIHTYNNGFVLFVYLGSALSIET